MKRLVLAVLLVALMATAIASVAPVPVEANTKNNVALAPTEARTISDVIYQGQEKGWFLNPGDTLVVYYYPVGRSSTVAWKNNWFYWLYNQPFTTINIYCAPGAGGPWTWMYADSVVPYYRSLPLFHPSKVAYKFVIKNYTKGDMVYLKVY